jgi:hypothetical protein
MRKPKKMWATASRPTKGMDNLASPQGASVIRGGFAIRIECICCLVIAAVGLLPLRLAASQKLSLPSGLFQRADIYVEPCATQARATLVLCPGHNGNGQEFVADPRWLLYAREEKLNLVGLSFASDDNKPGYFQVASGSGKLLLDGLKQVFGTNQPPLLIYGFSRGAQFTYSFSSWQSDRVLAWCAYSATDWEVPTASVNEPKGIIACGDEDESNYSFSVLQFLKGRALGKPWTWISLAHTGHVASPQLDELVRTYFKSVLDHPQEKGLWLDVDTKTEVSTGEIQEEPTLSCWLPDADTARAWKALHQP